MLSLFRQVQSLLEIDTVNIDNTICRLHHKATVAILLVFSFIVTGKQFIGDPIDCIGDVEAISFRLFEFKFGKLDSIEYLNLSLDWFANLEV